MCAAFKHSSQVETNITLHIFCISLKKKMRTFLLCLLFRIEFCLVRIFIQELDHLYCFQSLNILVIVFGPEKASRLVFSQIL